MGHRIPESGGSQKGSMMISESHYWKRPLLRAATWLERLRIEDMNEERVLVRVERELFVGFYAIRKLLDTFKISPSTRTTMLAMVWSPCIKTVDYMNAHRIDELFDLDVKLRKRTTLC
jgi:hypothetical protein